jgi:hypothetical protein
MGDSFGSGSTRRDFVRASATCGAHIALLAASSVDTTCSLPTPCGGQNFRLAPGGN